MTLGDFPLTGGRISFRLGLFHIPAPRVFPVAQEEIFQKESPYEVKLEVFEGPLELLLHLVKENEIDIFDIPIAQITDQYLRYLDLMRSLNIDVAGDYLLMASTLVYLKSRSLLPQTEEEEEQFEEEVREKLVEPLLEYRRMKELSLKLREAEGERLHIFTRGADGDGFFPEGGELPLEVSLFELISAFEKILRERGFPDFHQVEVDELEVADRQGLLLERLAGHDGLSFEELFTGIVRPLELVVTFLALLELIKRRLILVKQPSPFASIRIFRAETHGRER